MYVKRTVSNLNDSAFALSGLMTAVMEMIGMMIDMQEPPGYSHLLGYFRYLRLEESIFCGHQRRILKADRHISVTFKCCQKTFLLSLWMLLVSGVLL